MHDNRPMQERELPDPDDWWVYILRCADGSLYTGMARDLMARLQVHNAGKGAKYTRGRRPLELVYQEACPHRSAALKREYQLKRLSRSAKEALIVASRALAID
ncbi:MAG: GIY-YIG nuclease family protein [gamma proteobacterium symbiont of Bathyaustriella thionipta]|nr:GIY-YIG nuclease family protein [gamma proteobacterium symbiont of Bathyaustriella thionipta]